MPSPRLLVHVRLAIRRRHYSRRTEEAYVLWVRRFVRFHDLTHPTGMGAPEVTAFLTHLATERRVSASTQNQAASALLFLYREVLNRDLERLELVVRAKRPQRRPVVLTRHEVGTLLGHLTGDVHLVSLLLYGGGLRLLEALRLRVKDVDLERREISVRRGKAARDRMRPARQGRSRPNDRPPRRRRTAAPREAPPEPRAVGARRETRRRVGGTSRRLRDEVTRGRPRVTLAVDLPCHPNPSRPRDRTAQASSPARNRRPARGQEGRSRVRHRETRHQPHPPPLHRHAPPGRRATTFGPSRSSSGTAVCAPPCSTPTSSTRARSACGVPPTSSAPCTGSHPRPAAFRPVRLPDFAASVAASILGCQRRPFDPPFAGSVRLLDGGGVSDPFAVH